MEDKGRHRMHALPTNLQTMAKLTRARVLGTDTRSCIVEHRLMFSKNVNTKGASKYVNTLGVSCIHIAI